MSLNPLDITTLFNKAKEIYGQTNDTFYVSTKGIGGLHLAVLPYRNEYVFSSYNFGDDSDVQTVNDHWHTDKVFKTFECTLCPIRNKDNAVIISETQNQLYLDPKTPSMLLQTVWKSSEGRNYIITATVPQYYYNHLLFVADDHIPTYGVFTNSVLFKNVFDYLSAVYTSDNKVTAAFNGAAGSDIYHFHLHLTNQHLNIIEYIWAKLDYLFKQNPTTMHYEPVEFEIIRGVLLASSNIEHLFIFAQRFVLKYFILSPNRATVALTANFGARKVTASDGRQFFVYMLFFQLTNKIKMVNNEPVNNYVKYVDNCDYMLIPAAYIVKANCFNINPQNYNLFQDQLINAFGDVYIPFDINELYIVLNNGAVSQEFSSGLITSATDMDAMPVEKVYNIIDHYFNDFRYNNTELPPELVHHLQVSLLTILGTGADCYLQTCEWDYNAKYQYLLGMYIITLPPDRVQDFLRNSAVAQVRIKAIMKYLRNYNGYKGDMVQTDYLYFKGTYLAELLRKTFENLLLVTTTTDIDINDWLKYIFDRIGEPSASGTNTVSKLRDIPKIDFVMKIMRLTDSRKQSEFQHEFLTSLQINTLREYIPNYILCYGGLSCGCNVEYDSNGNISDIGLCNKNAQEVCSYILVEYIKQSNTVGRHIKLPNLTYSGEADDYADMMLQIFTALIYGQSLEEFTHYDLHVDNVMAYDFIKNPNYLKLFKIWKEYEGTKVPAIKSIYFVYYILSTDGEQIPIIIPAKYLYLIIDYGSAYVKGLPSYHTFPERVANIGMTSNRSKPVADVYTFSMSVMLNVMIYKPYLVFDEANGVWLDNKLTAIIQKVLRSYSELFIDVESIIAKLPQRSSWYTENRYWGFKSYMDRQIKQQYQVSHFQYLHKNFEQNMVADDFNDAIKVVWWIYNKLYDSADLKRKLNDPEVYVFNWGGPYLPQGVLQGIEPNVAINKLLIDRKEKQKQDIAKVRSFTRTLQ